MDADAGGNPRQGVLLHQPDLRGHHALRLLSDADEPHPRARRQQDADDIAASGLSLNIIFEPIAILVFDWGIPGAALATLASQVCGNLLCFVFILRKVPALHAHRHDWRPDLKFYWEHLRIALPMGFQSSIIAIGAVILQVALNDLGPLAVAAYAAAQKIESIAMMPMMSFGIAMSAYTAQNYGARKFERIGEGVRKCCYMSVAFAVLAGAGLIFFGPSLMHLFIGDGAQQVIDFGHEYRSSTARATGFSRSSSSSATRCRDLVRASCRRSRASWSS